MDIFNLYAKLSLDKSDYEKALGIASAESKQTANEVGADFEKIADKSKDAGDAVEKNFKKSNDSVKVSFKGMTAAAVTNVISLVEKAGQYIQKFAAQMMELVNYADRYGALAGKYDMSTQSLQELDYIASQSGTDLDSLLSVMTQLYSKAEAGDDVFQKLGISVKDNNGNMKDMDALFWETKSALDEVSDSGDKSALMLEVFGKNAMSVGEFLRKDTDELVGMADKANKLGLVLNDSTISSASSFKNLLSELKQQGMTAFSSLLMGAEDGGEMVNDFFDRVMGLINDNFPKLAQTLIKMLIKISTRLIAMVPDLFGQFINEIAKINWFEVGWDIAKSIAQGIINGLIGMLEAVVNEVIKVINFIPGVNIPYLDLGRVNFMGNNSGETSAAETINQSSATSQMLADNSTNNYNITMNTTGNLEYDAKELYERISIARQSRGTI